MATLTINKPQSKPQISSWKERLSVALVQNESGAVLIVTLVLLAIMITLVPVALQMTTEEMDRTLSFKENRELFYLAEAGLEHGKSVAENTTFKTLLAGPDGLVNIGVGHFDNNDNGTVAGVGDTADATPFTWMGVPYDDVAFGTQGGTYYFRVYDNNDDADNNTDIDGLVYIESVGVNAEGDVKTLRLLVRKLAIPPVPGAVTAVGAISEIEIETPLFTVQGVVPGTTNGFALDGTEDTTCPGVNGMALESPGLLEIEFDLLDLDDLNEDPCATQTCVKLELDSTGAEITGIGGGSIGNPDIVTGQTSFTALDAARLFRQLTVIDTPDYVYTDYQPAADVTFGSPAAPVVVYVSNEMEVDTVTVTGYGILIVNEELEVDAPGFLNWTGLVLFGVCPTCIPDEFEFEADNALITGAVIAGGEEIEFDEAGTVRYSCAGLAIAGLALGATFDTISWEEVS